MLLYFAGSASKNKYIQEIIYGSGLIQNHLSTYANLLEIKAKLSSMFLHLTDTTARIQGSLSCKALMAEKEYTASLYSFAYPNQREQWEEYYKMLIHLAEVSNERGQYQSRIDTRFPHHLLSFAYRNEAMHGFTKTWNMLIYLAGHSATKNTEQVRVNYESHLTTFADKQEVSSLFETCVNDKLLPRILIDSGAFTAYTTGKVITVKEYGDWALNFKKQWESKVKSLHFFNLDVIGSQEKSNANLHKLEAMGLKPIPIFTFNADIKDLIYYLNNYEYLAFGGLVGRPPTVVMKWLDFCYKQVNNYYKETGELRKTHLLGVTKREMLERYPLYSCDSSGWVSCLRFGGGKAIGKAKIPKYTESPEALKITIATLKAEIGKYAKLQDDVTKLWAKRGITWE